MNYVRIMILACVISLASAAWAQPATDPADTEASKELVDSAKFIQQKFDSLLMAMSQVAAALEETQPEVAKILLQTVAHAQREDVSQKLDLVVARIQQGLDEAAQKGQSDVIGDLQKMLRILEGSLTEESETDKLLQERRATVERLTALIEKQRTEEWATRAAALAKEMDQDTAALIQALQVMIAKQKKLVKTTEELPKQTTALAELDALRKELRKQIEAQDKLATATAKAGVSQLPLIARSQKALETAAGSLSKRIAAAASKAGAGTEAVAKAAKHVEWAKSEMANASEALSKNRSDRATGPQGQASADLRAAEKALNQAIAEMAKGSDAAKAAAEQGKLAAEAKAMSGKSASLAEKAGVDMDKPDVDTDKPDAPACDKDAAAEKMDKADAAAEEMNKADAAAKEMDKAAARLEASNKKPACEAQKKADAPAGDMDAAAKEMNKAADRLEASDKKPAGEAQKKALVELEKELRRAKELRRRAMAKAKKALDATKQKEIATDAEKTSKRMSKDSQGKPMAGAGEMKRAAKKASSAGGKMSQGKPGQANKDQKEAQKDMESALKKLEEEVAELERRSQMEKLATIEERLEKVLERHTAQVSETKKAFASRQESSPHYDRQGRQQLAGASKGEKSAAKDVDVVRKMLMDEGSTLVFPEALQDVSTDLGIVADRLDAQQAGATTQRIQQDISETLTELIRAVREELSKGPGRGAAGGGCKGGGGGGKKPLIPPIAELRMLRLQQVRIARGTRRVEAQRQRKELTAGEAKTQSRRLAVQQQKIVDLAAKIGEKMKKGTR